MLQIKRFEKTAEGDALERLLQEANLRLGIAEHVEGYIFPNAVKAEQFLASKVGSTRAFYALCEGRPALVICPTPKNNLKQSILIACMEELQHFKPDGNLALALVAPHELSHVKDANIYYEAEDLVQKYNELFMCSAPTALHPYESSAGETIMSTALECRADRRAIDAGYAKEYLAFLKVIAPDMTLPSVIFACKMLWDAGHTEAKELEKKILSINPEYYFRPDLIDKIYNTGSHLDHEKLATLLLSP